MEMGANSTLDRFCGSAFWNANVTWYTEDPDLTKCFERTILVWIPCGFLWLFAALELFYILSSKKRDVPWNFLNIIKIFITLILIGLSLTDFGLVVQKAIEDTETVYSVDMYTPMFKILTFMLSICLIVYNRKCGLSTSGTLFLFWLLLALCGAFQFRTEVRQWSQNKIEFEYNLVGYMIYYGFVILMLLLNCFADREPRELGYPVQRNPLPEERASFLSRLLFSWFDSFVWYGFRKPIVDQDLWDLKLEDSANGIVPLFEKHWNNTLAKCQKSEIPVRKTRASFTPDEAHLNIENTVKRKQASIIPALMKSFGPTFLFGCTLKLCQDVLTFVSPQILNLLINFVKVHDYQWKGFFYVALLFITAMIQTLILAQYFNRMFIIGMRIRTALVTVIYKKALRISNKARRVTTVGEIVNLMSVDAQKFIELTPYLNMLWSAPLQILLAIYFLWRILGISVLAGLTVMIVLIPINGWIARKIKILQVGQMHNKDERVKLINEVLTGIKVLKLYAWEPSFEQQILTIRGREVQVLKETAYLNAFTAFIWSCAPFLVSLITFAVYVYSDPIKNQLTPETVFVSLTLFSIIRIPLSLLPLVLVSIVEVSLVTFATYVLVDETHVLDANKAFVSVSLYNILRFPLSMLPMMISNAVQTSVSIKRINTFMNSDELDVNSVTHDANESEPIVIDDGTFAWNLEPTLTDINVRIHRGSLTAVVGAVGAGKSSLISACLGEMEKLNGQVNVYGKVAYVGQQAWIQNASLRDNILFGRPYKKSEYERVLHACALKPDLAMLTAGDQTEIGEKGINLSGGQKQRVSLARAVYSESDIYFLDDPLSAVDSHVGKHIFEYVIGPEGLLRQKTRILVTHGVTYLPYTDKIYVLRDGTISESGTHQQLMNREGAFAEFLLQHLNEVDDNDETELNTIKEQLGSCEEIQQEITRKLSRARSIRTSESVSETGSLQRHHSDDSLERTPVHQHDPTADDERLIETEKAETGNVKWSVYKHYLKSIGWILCIATVVLNMIFQAFSIGSNVWLGRWADDQNVIVNGTVDTSKRDFYLGIYGVLGVGQAITIYLSALALYVGTLNGARLEHNFLLANILRAPSTTFFDVTPVGRILNRFSKDVDTLDNTLPTSMRGWISCFFAVLGTLVVISYTTPIFVFVIIPIGVIYYFIQRFYVATSRQLKRIESISRSPIYSHFSETLTGASVIRAYEQQDRFIIESDRRVDTNQACYYPSVISNRWLAVRLEMIGNLIILFAALFAVLGKDQNPGLVGLSVTYALQITQTLNWLVRMTSEVETNIVAVERIKEYGEAPQEAAWQIPQALVPAQWPETGTVEFRDFSVRYRPGLDLVLKRVNFKIRGGEKVGIVGRTGAGKTSLTLSLFRLIEAASGDIYIDDVNIAEMGLHTLRARLTIIPQDAVLFSGTLRMNLDPFDQWSDAEVWRALEHAHLKGFVDGPNIGLQYNVTEGGENLSVGQRQLVCLSRALLRKTKVLILDEATAAVDLQTDDLIQETIRSEFADCTVLTIAHRLNTIMDSDRIIVLDKGRVVEFDTPSILLSRHDSIFYSMCHDAGLV